jgi:uncharacterized protein with NRDE domain
MCLAVVALGAHPRYALVVAANRDEFHARAAAPAAWGEDEPFVDVFAGRDLAAGGTWFAAHRNGRWALVTNVREGGRNDPAASSRGALVPQVLNAADPDAAFSAIEAAAQRYNGFNLLAGDAQGAQWMSNRGAGGRRLQSGLHGLSNALIDTPWPKVVGTRARLATWAAAGDPDVEPVFAALADRTRAADALLPATGVPLETERMLSSPFIVSANYGTRCSTVLTIDHMGVARFLERTFDARGEMTGAASTEFRLPR